ncbi:hypothetical protein [Agrobacterium vitis]|uniref:hypothetical protein n=1 Tax=Agrobacterium vitis TaxID=373 RepID=UPI000872C626|nr:hypothetical protein [Agrobacterium vitis]MCE6076795.1 hypothetical protein [Agrobacterium vitis]MCM2450124.1 hypothetical protein [Agrobacterium vitis]MCM2471026.1 hypothetical protein [Agrobacterium vitis]MUO71179.1 hypothetical protein [Agrobacterium vitis]MUO84357.1 hypothetical protein [Agrobacterium vitis]
MSLCDIANPFSAGKQPITRVEWHELANVLPACNSYGIEVSRRQLHPRRSRAMADQMRAMVPPATLLWI